MWKPQSKAILLSLTRGGHSSPFKNKDMTRKEFNTLKEGDSVILQKSGDLNGSKGIVKGISINSVVVRMETGMYLVFGYEKMKVAK